MSDHFAALSFETVAASEPDAQASLNAYYTELDDMFPSGFDPQEWMALTPEDTTEPHGCFVLARLAGETVGCGAVKTLEPGVAEIKRMWIHPDQRGRGLGRRLLADLEDRARAMGHHTVRLDTSTHLPVASAFYRSAGYREIPPYNDNPYAGQWFEKRLS